MPVSSTAMTLENYTENPVMMAFVGHLQFLVLISKTTRSDYDSKRVLTPSLKTM